MEYLNLLSKSNEFIEALNSEIDGLEISSSHRIRAAVGCLHLALEHHSAIVGLYGRPLAGSAGALIRPQLDAYVRGAWLNRCATDAEVEQYLQDKCPVSFGAMVSALEKHQAFSDGDLSAIKANSWSALSSYTHGGALQVTRRNTETEITGNYSEEEIMEAIEFVNTIGLLCAVEVAHAAENDELAMRLWGIYQSHFTAAP